MSALKYFEDLFEGKTLDDLSSRFRCVKCRTKKDSWKELHPHHITYKPAVVKRLCYTCHACITFANWQYTNKLRLKRSLTNEERINIWQQFLKAQLSDRYIKTAVIWFDSKYGNFY
jgi:hypothetical protein